MDEVITPAALAASASDGSHGFPERLADRVGAFAPTGFAVLDGGHYDDLPGLLRGEGLFARSLFLEHADIEAERAGPWLVPLALADDAPDKVFRLVGTGPRAVFWSCDIGATALHRHLRTLNLARIPAWAAAGENAPRAEQFGQGYETVTFRHWDPCVLAALLPVLDAEQFARLLGCAQEVALHCEAFGGLKRVVRDPGWPAAPGGLLTIRDEQMIAFGKRREDVACRRAAAYLRVTANEQVGRLDRAALQEAASTYLAEATALGLTRELSRHWWAHMRATCPQDLFADPGIRRYLADPAFGATPDTRIERLFRLRTDLLRRRYG